MSFEKEKVENINVENVESNDNLKLIEQRFLNDHKYNLIINNSQLLEIITIFDVLPYFCFQDETYSDIIYIDYRYLKINMSKDNYTSIINYIISVFEKSLLTNDMITYHIFVKSLTLSDIENHYNFICDLTLILREKFPDKLNKCYIYKAPFIFSSLLSIISNYIDKNTFNKIQLIKY